jgi:hypothetical protein
VRHATRLGALRDDNLTADINGILDMIHVLALADELCARILNFVGEGTGIAERQHDGCRPILENIGQQ